MSDHQLVYIEWVDSASQYGWNDPDDGKVSSCRTVGFLIREDDEQVVVAQSLSSTEHVHNMIAIPKGAITVRRTPVDFGFLIREDDAVRLSKPLETPLFTQEPCEQMGHLWGDFVITTDPPKRECLRCGLTDVFRIGPLYLEHK